MDIHLYALSLERPLRADERERLRALLPQALRERKDASLCACAMLRHAVRELFSWETLPEIAAEEHGRPCFPAHREAHFSLSHSVGAVLVGVHDAPLGVDIERLRPVRTARLKAALGAASERDFWQRWTAYESRCKRRGVSAAARRDLRLPEDGGERLLPLGVFPDCAACVCTNSKINAVKLNYMTIDMLK